MCRQQYAKCAERNMELTVHIQGYTNVKMTVQYTKKVDTLTMNCYFDISVDGL